MVLSASDGRSLEGDVGVVSSSTVSSPTIVQGSSPKLGSGMAAAEIHCCEDWRRSEPAVAELDRRS
jgi:hypothetical protein